MIAQSHAENTRINYTWMFPRREMSSFDLGPGTGVTISGPFGSLGLCATVEVIELECK
jgi:hypothetical protein